MKKITEATIALILVFFSFYYTDKAVDFVRSKDPLMEEIKSLKTIYEEQSINAKIVDNKLIPGINGKVINEETTFEKMKQYGEFNETLIVYKEEEPEKTMNEYYDYFIERGNSVKNMVSLVFEVNNNDDIKNIRNILKEQSIKATFFIDGIYIKNNQTMIKDLVSEGHEVQVLNYDGRYTENKFQEALIILEDITNIKAKYCYAKYDSKEVLELCSTKQMHTIVPSIQVDTTPLLTVKEKLDSGSVISLPINNVVEQELLSTINYIKQKGYDLETIDTLLNESMEK